MHRLFRAVLPQQLVVPLPVTEEAAARVRAHARRARAGVDGDHPRAARAGGGRHEVPFAGDAGAHRRRGSPLRPAADSRRDCHGLRPHRHAVRVRAGRRRARSHHAVEGLDGRHLAARRDDREHARLRGVLERRFRARADARADVRRESARVRRRERVARPVRVGAAPTRKSRRSSSSFSAGSPRAARSTACATCASRAQSASCSSRARRSSRRYARDSCGMVFGCGRSATSSI